MPVTITVIITIIFILLVVGCKIKRSAAEKPVKQITSSDLIKNPICPWCKTGKDSIELDRTSPVCPYIASLKNGSCPYYKPIEN